MLVHYIKFVFTCTKFTGVPVVASTYAVKEYLKEDIYRIALLRGVTNMLILILPYYFNLSSVVTHTVCTARAQKICITTR